MSVLQKRKWRCWGVRNSAKVTRGGMAEPSTELQESPVTDSLLPREPRGLWLSLPRLASCFSTQWWGAHDAPIRQPVLIPGAMDVYMSLYWLYFLYWLKMGVVSCFLSWGHTCIIGECQNTFPQSASPRPRPRP